MKESRDPLDWWRRAIKDHKAARVMHGSDPDDLAEPIWVACQQACEKMLKAYLLLRGKRFRRTHDLTELAEQVGDTLPDIIGYLPDLVELSVGYIPSR